MKIVQGDELEWIRGLEHRGGMFHSRRLLEGTPGTIDNFQVNIGRNDKDFVSPRHRHNFDQFRVQLEGDLDFARDGKMTPGTVGYFPEGAHYGPQTSEMTATTIVLQFGSASGSGYLSNKEVRQGMEELRKFGSFEAGVYRRNEEVPGKRNLDGYQAIWEHMNRREMVYPKPRYPAALMMNGAHFDWVPIAGSPGVAQKLLGVFTERRAQADFVKLDPGAAFTASGRGIYVASAGKGRVEGQDLRPFTAVFLDWGERATFGAETETQMIHFGLPDLRDLAAHSDAYSAVAAE
jgi:hypothetical protein